MDFNFNDKQELINCINNLNQEYYKPADKLFKMYEEYSRKKAIPLLEFFRDAHDCLAKAIMIKDIVNRKEKIVDYLKKYVRILQMLLIHEYVGLTTERKNDLLKVIIEPEKEKVQGELSPRWAELREYPAKDLNYNIKTVDELNEAVNFYKNTYELVEKSYINHKI